MTNEELEKNYNQKEEELKNTANEINTYLEELSKLIKPFYVLLFLHDAKIDNSKRVSLMNEIIDLITNKINPKITEYNKIAIDYIDLANQLKKNGNTDTHFDNGKIIQLADYLYRIIKVYEHEDIIDNSGLIGQMSKDSKLPISKLYESMLELISADDFKKNHPLDKKYDQNTIIQIRPRTSDMIQSNGFIQSYKGQTAFAKDPFKTTDFEPTKTGDDQTDFAKDPFKTTDFEPTKTGNDQKTGDDQTAFAKGPFTKADFEPVTTEDNQKTGDDVQDNKDENDKKITDELEIRLCTGYLNSFKLKTSPEDYEETMNNFYNIMMIKRSLRSIKTDKNKNKLYYKVIINAKYMFENEEKNKEITCFLTKDEIIALLKINKYLHDLNKDDNLLLSINIIKRYERHAEGDYDLKKFLITEKKNNNRSKNRNKNRDTSIIESAIEIYNKLHPKDQIDMQPQRTIENDIVKDNPTPLEAEPVTKRKGSLETFYYEDVPKEVDSHGENPEKQEEKPTIEKPNQDEKKDTKSQDKDNSILKFSIPSDSMSLSKYRLKIYQVIINEIRNRGLELSEEAFYLVLNELYENQEENNGPEIRYENNKYSISIEDDVGDEQSITISYNGFIKIVEKFMPKEEENIYTVENGSFRFKLNLKEIEPEQIDTVKAVLYTAIANDEIGINNSHLFISAYIIDRLKRSKARMEIMSTGSDLAVESGYKIHGDRISEAKDYHIPLLMDEGYKPINITICLPNNKNIEIVLEPKDEELKRIK